MIGAGPFGADVARAGRLLDSLNLSAYQNPRPANDVATIRRIRTAKTYLEEYQAYISLQAFDVMLNDGSLIFFRRAPGDSTLLSYGFLECPYEALTYPEFVAEYFGSEANGSLDVWDDYEEYRTQVDLRPHITPLRYDWSPDLYREGAHPAAHLHVGFRTEVRLAVEGLLGPSQFLLIVLRHFYLSQWEKTASHMPEVVSIASGISDDAVTQNHRKPRDHLELRLTSLATMSRLASTPARRRR